MFLLNPLLLLSLLGHFSLLASSEAISTTTTATTHPAPASIPTSNPSHTSPWRHNRTRESSEIHYFLKLFGWLPSNTTLPDTDIPSAIRKIQKVLRKPQTGVYDDTIENAMAKPHCGTEPPYNETDADEATVVDASNRTLLAKRYTIWGPKWDHTSLTYRFINYASDLPPERQRAILATAFSTWTSLVPLTITPAPPSLAIPDIHIQFTSLGPSETAYAATSMLAYGLSLAAGLINITFNSDYNWSDDRLFNYTALHEIGHALGLSHSKVQNAVMWPFYDGTIRPMYSDDMGAVHQLYGWRTPRWSRIGADSGTRGVVEVSSPSGSRVELLDGLYQLRSNGQVLWYSAQGSWVSVDNNPVTVQIAGAGGNLYQRHADGSIYKYSGASTSWLWIGNSDSNIVDIIAAGDQIYQRRRDGWVARWSGSGRTWHTIEQPLSSRQIVVSEKKVLYNLQTNGDLVRSEWPYGNGWTIIDQNPAIDSIAVGGDDFYKLHMNGQIFWLDTAYSLWRLIDDAGAKVIFAEGEFLYCWHRDGGIWRYTGTPFVWEQLDGTSNSQYVIGDSKGAVWEMLQNGEILRLVS
ncbi:hypothetical protein GQ43DRAFT_470510 [Delitschia confertaspora ATCC 74209]|uniref:Peptidase metallopeptidase domain-containing protein n=1 Tax=Delitschia confertaspora ATCC 74209 TaxID=1513339 RepID=A0A9P4MRD4_9PLEO|nr:hypothetical protein GQ43DRAFT_470510 [Delitschia confertaspora ATCC 74209]